MLCINLYLLLSWLFGGNGQWFYGLFVAKQQSSLFFHSYPGLGWSTWYGSNDSPLQEDGYFIGIWQLVYYAALLWILYAGIDWGNFFDLWAGLFLLIWDLSLPVEVSLPDRRYLGIVAFSLFSSSVVFFLQVLHGGGMCYRIRVVKPAFSWFSVNVVMPHLKVMPHSNIWYWIGFLTKYLT